jgi:ssDNA-binding Zn-finger/Zn-ribbon topoisomerase 1
MRFVEKSRHGPFWSCTRWPKCDGTIGAHKASGDPLGTPADPDTRAARIRAHAAFDPLWQGKSARFRGRRKLAYRWLALELGIPKGLCHIAMMDAATCERVVELCAREAA